MHFQMWSTPFNPFSWEKSSHQVTTPVASLEVRDQEEHNISLTGLSPGITILLPWQPLTFPSNCLSFIRPGLASRHNFSVQHDYSLVKILIPLCSDDYLVLYFRVSHPTHALSQNAGLLECKRVQGQWLNSRNINCVGETNLTISFKPPFPGNYFFEIDFRGKWNNIKVDKQEVSEISTNECINVKEPPHQQSDLINYTLTITEVGCFFWNSSEPYWDTRGCRVRSS